MLWSRLGPHDPAELDRLLWEERKLVEWNAFIWPIEDLPLLRARMRRRQARAQSEYEWERRGAEFLKENASFRRYVLRELDRRGPLLARELEDRSARQRETHPGGARATSAIMLELLQARGEVAIVGRRGKQRVWDLAERWYPRRPSASRSHEAQRAFEEKRWRAAGVRLVKGEWHAHPEASDEPVDDRVTLLSPFDRLIHDRTRMEALFGLPLPARDVRAEGEAGVRLLRAADSRRRPARRPRRAGLRPQDRHARRARRVGRHVATRRSAREPRGFLTVGVDGSTLGA